MPCSSWPTQSPSVTRPPPTPATERLFGFYRHLALWVLQGWLAMFYFGAGYAKVTQSPEKLALMMQWPAEVYPAFVHQVGWAEIGAAVGMLVPLAPWRRLRWVLLAAAVGLAADAATMTVYHGVAGPPLLSALNGALFLMAGLVVAGRRHKRRETRRKTATADGRTAAPPRLCRSAQAPRNEGG